MKDFLTYDPSTRRILDENGLKVAENVLPEDGPRLAGAYNLIGEIMAYEAEAFDGDGEVNACDLVDVFAAWRRMVCDMMADREAA